MFNCLDEWRGGHRLEDWPGLESFVGMEAQRILRDLQSVKPGYEAKVLGNIVKGMCMYPKGDWRNQSDWILTGGRLVGIPRELNWNTGEKNITLGA